MRKVGEGATRPKGNNDGTICNFVISSLFNGYLKDYGFKQSIPENLNVDRYFWTIATQGEEMCIELLLKLCM